MKVKYDTWEDVPEGVVVRCDVMVLIKLDDNIVAFTSDVPEGRTGWCSGYGFVPGGPFTDTRW